MEREVMGSKGRVEFFILWGIGLGLMVAGGVFGLASSEDYSRILWYCMGLEALALAAFLKLYRASGKTGKIVCSLTIMMSLFLMLQAWNRIF
ncbi:hypothetical protein EZJ49_09220 [Bdellovibrio bacteriovorus]|uniref:hypothetical protein n=1 Tax=Bdellovibrio bacteriovorus TaxID=959 RepID=UPI0021D22331|nr:hypothetical protein [Bdellovibrio bacteriovorus]UXR63258.1 hypothetical protein EZJ49_09220 [Bdellovibrio bacteriovorus]